MYSQILLIAIGAWAIALTRVIREPARCGDYYLYLLLAIGGLLIAGADEDLLGWGVAGIAMTAISVVLPFVLDILSRALWDASCLRFAAMLASLRGHLLLGGASMLSAEIWTALSHFPTRGVGAVVADLRALKKNWDGPGALLMLDDQIFGAYALDGQWSMALQSLSVSEEDPLACHRVSAALRMRAYLELGQYEPALSLLEQAAQTEMPSAFSMRVQWVFLAMTSHPDIERLRKDKGLLRALGMSPASALLWLAMLHRSKGRFAKANEALDRSLTAYSVQKIFHRRMVEVLRESMEALNSAELPSELMLARRSAREAFEVARGKVPKFLPGKGALLALMMIAGGLARLIASLSDGGGVDALLTWGALTPEVWANHAWWRVTTAPWLSVDLFGWLLVAYLWWVSAYNGPSRFGALRWVLALLVAPSGALLVMALSVPRFAGAGQSSLALVAAIVTAMWSGPQGLALRGRSRGWTLVIGALLLIKLGGVAMIPGGGPVAAMTLLVCAALSSLALGPWQLANSVRPSWVARLLVGGWALAWPLIRLDPGPTRLLRAEPLQCQALGVDWELPDRFAVPHTALRRTSLMPELQGWIDAGAWEGRSRVQLGVVERAPGLAADAMSSLAKWPKLAKTVAVTAPSFSLPDALQKALDAGHPGLRAVELRQGGQSLGLLVERDLPAQDRAAVDPEAAVEPVRSIVMLWQPRRPSRSYAPSQLHALLSARSSDGVHVPCPGTADLDTEVR